MAKYNFDTTARPCPVAALADEARQLIDAHIAVDAEITPIKADYSTQAHKDALLQATTTYLDAAMRRASYTQATSAKGALFQLCSIAHHVLDLDDMIIREIDARTPDASKAIMRLLHSIADFIEETTGANLDEACGDWFMSQQASEPGRLAEALEISKTAQDSASKH